MNLRKCRLQAENGLLDLGSYVVQPGPPRKTIALLGTLPERRSQLQDQLFPVHREVRNDRLERGLARLPRPEEIERARHWISQTASPREGLQDVLWALLNSREFMFNH